MRQDSVIILPPQGSMFDILPQKPSRPQTPYQVLRLLPKDATPAQQDSAIQAWFEPEEIHFSEQPDTLHLPGESVPRDLKAVDIPQYYRENFFSKDTLYHAELQAGHYGVAGDPVPSTIGNDDIITTLLVLCFLYVCFTFAKASRFIGRELKSLFYPKQGEKTIMETGSELKLQIALVGLTSLVLGLLYYLYTTTFVADTFNLSSDYILIGIFTTVFLLYFALRFLVYTAVNILFFSKGRNKKFLTSLLFLISMEGVLAYPVVLLLAYFHFQVQNAIYYCAAVFILVKILTFYKSFIIFFSQNRLFLQNILYFCALEIVPLFAVWGELAAIVDIFKIKF